MDSKKLLFDENGVYNYKGIELMPSVIADIIVAFYSGKLFRRSVVLDEIIEFHRKNGGVTNKNEYASAYKRACLVQLKDKIVNKGYGMWYVMPDEVSENESIEEEIESSEIEDGNNNDESFQQSDKVIGSGDKAVYVYYYDTYKQCAELQGNSVWACKIGRTDTDPISRVFGQAGTCYPELPHIALIIHCPNSSIIETTLHNILKLRGKWIENAPGTEWFITSPEEVENIYYSLFDNQD